MGADALMQFGPLILSSRASGVSKDPSIRAFDSFAAQSLLRMSGIGIGEIL